MKVRKTGFEPDIIKYDGSFAWMKHATRVTIEEGIYDNVNIPVRGGSIADSLAGVTPGAMSHV